MDQKKYRPVAGEDKDYFINEPTGGLYKKLKLLMLNSVGTGMGEKLAVAKEFKLVKDFTDKEELKQFQEKLANDEMSIEEFFEQAFLLLFMEAKEVPFDKLNLNQLNKGISDFFTSASGS